MEIKVPFVPFVSEYKDCRATRPPPSSLFPSKSSNYNFEIAILFVIVERSNDFALGYNMTPPKKYKGKVLKL